jgi:hypothetical protein
MLRALAYPRLVSIDNFRQPNFPLVAEVDEPGVPPRLDSLRLRLTRVPRGAVRSFFGSSRSLMRAP